MTPDDPTASPNPRNRHPHEAEPDADPTATPTTDPVVARLRSALDELTTGAEPTQSGMTSLSSRRQRRWLLPAVAAAAAIGVVGVAIAVAGGGGNGTTPAAPTPSGNPIPTQPPPGNATIPWYELTVGDATADEPVDTSVDAYVPQVWAAADYSRVLVAFTAEEPNATAEPDDWPIVEALPDVPVGAAWAFSNDDLIEAWHGIYWAPDDTTSVILTGAGFTPDDLAALLPALRVEANRTVVSALSSLLPLPTGPDSGLYTSAYALGGTDDEPIGAFISVSPSGAGRPLSLWAPAATSTAPTSTPFGDGFRMEMVSASTAQTIVWWQVDDGPTWAGFSAPADRFDELFALVRRVADIPTPGAFDGPDFPATSLPGDPSQATVPSSCVELPEGERPATTTPPALGATTTTMNPCPPALTSMTTTTTTTTPQPPPGGETTTSTTTALLATTAPPPFVEPAMTAAVPSTLPSGWRPPIAVGESVMLSAVKGLSERGIEVHAQEAVQASGIAEQLEALRAADRFGDVVIVQAGTNGTATEADLDRMMAAVADVPRVVVLTVHADAPWIAPNNELIRDLPNRYPNVVVVDWDAIATTCDCLVSDDIHVDDRDVYADAVTAAADLG